MLSGSAIVRVVLLIVAAAGLAWIVQAVWLQGREPEAAAPALARVSPDEPTAPAPALPRREPAKGTAGETANEPAREPARSVAEAPPSPAPAPADPAPPIPPPPPPVAQTATPTPPDPAVEAEANAPPAAIALVDLNTAPLAALNGLKGGGAIGRTIIQHRPYTSIDQLLSKRVLSRATYQRIKDQVTVQ